MSMSRRGVVCVYYMDGKTPNTTNRPDKAWNRNRDRDCIEKMCHGRIGRTIMIVFRGCVMS